MYVYKTIKLQLKKILPEGMLNWIRNKRRRFGRRPPVGFVRFGSLRRLEPISRVFGIESGLSICRYYIETFLGQYANDIQGHVLEIADNSYTIKFGGNRVSKSDILHVTANNPKATIIADLTDAKQIPAQTFDCIILTQTLQFIYDVNAVIKTVYRILKPNGVLLVTLSGISKISRYDMDQWGEYWRFTSLSAYRLFTEEFHKDYITIKSYGNVLTGIAYLEGLVAEELRIAELDYCDPDYEVLIAVRAQKKPG